MALRQFYKVHVLGALVFASGCLPIGLALAGFRLQWTDSLPKGLYRDVHVATVRPGMLGIWCLPVDAARLARERAYVGRGSCPAGAEPVGKLVLAATGDSARFDSSGVRINGVVVPDTRPLARDSRGRALPHAVFRTYALAPDEVWLWSPYTPRSFDSRYFGPVLVTSLVVAVRPVWTMAPSPH
ncbi:MAG: conjugative transfer signal peptidase TraF [bacterium]